MDGEGAVSEPQNFVGILVSYTISLLFSAVEGVVERPLHNRMTDVLLGSLTLKAYRNGYIGTRSLKAEILILMTMWSFQPNNPSYIPKRNN